MLFRLQSKSSIRSLLIKLNDKVFKFKKVTCLFISKVELCVPLTKLTNLRGKVSGCCKYLQDLISAFRGTSPIGERFQEAVMFHSIGFDPWKYKKNLNYYFLSFPKGCVTCDSREASCEAAVADDSVENKGEPPPALPR